MKTLSGLLLVPSFCLLALGCGGSSAIGDSDGTPQSAIPAPIEDIEPEVEEPATDTKPAVLSDKDNVDLAAPQKDDIAKDDIENVVAQAPKPARSDNKIYEITFDDIKIGMQPDQRFRDFMLTERAREFDGRLIKISGNMWPDIQQKNIKEFVLLRNKTCKFGPGGQADHLLVVKLEKDKKTSFRNEDTVYEVTGRLEISPEHLQDFTLSIYNLHDATVTIK